MFRATQFSFFFLVVCCIRCLELSACQIEGIDHIYVINLKERVDKWEKTKQAFQGIDIQRFEAINGWALSPSERERLFAPYPVRLSGGQIGCLLSHLAIYQDALAKSYQTVWICEDDVTFLEDIHVLSPLLKKLSVLDPEWDIFYTDLREEKMHFQDPRPGQSPYTPVFLPVDDELVRILGRHTTHSMIFSQRGLKKAVEYFQGHSLWSAIDVDLHYIPGIRAYSARRNLVTSLNDSSSDTEPSSSFNKGPQNELYFFDLAEENRKHGRFEAAAEYYEKIEELKKKKPFVTVHLMGRLGNHLFQVATASALAWDRGVNVYLPPIERASYLEHVFFRCAIQPVRPSCEWREPDLAYHPIPYSPNIGLIGYFQSEKYFAHHREKLLELFAPSLEDQKIMEKKYGWLIHHPRTVGVQIRYYHDYEDPTGIYPQYGRDYLEKAMRYFPDSTLFVVSSNELEYARSQIPTWAKNVVFLENNPPYIELFLLSLCKHNIISNSSFGWWAAWLNQNPGKKVFCPLHLFNGLPYQDYCPPEWIRIEASENY